MRISPDIKLSYIYVQGMAGKLPVSLGATSRVHVKILKANLPAGLMTSANYRQLHNRGSATVPLRFDVWLTISDKSVP